MTSGVREKRLEQEGELLTEGEEVGIGLWRSTGTKLFLYFLFENFVQLHIFHSGSNISFHMNILFNMKFYPSSKFSPASKIAFSITHVVHQRAFYSPIENFNPHPKTPKPTIPKKPTNIFRATCVNYVSYEICIWIFQTNFLQFPCNLRSLMKWVRILRRVVWGFRWWYSTGQLPEHGIIFESSRWNNLNHVTRNFDLAQSKQFSQLVGKCRHSKTVFEAVKWPRRRRTCAVRPFINSTSASINIHFLDIAAYILRELRISCTSLFRHARLFC